MRSDCSREEPRTFLDSQLDKPHGIAPAPSIFSPRESESTPKISTKQFCELVDSRLSIPNCREQRGREPFPWNDKMKEGWNWRENNVERLNEQIENVPLMDYDVVASRDRDVNHGEDACANSDNENSSVCVYVCMCAYIWTGMLNRIHRLHVLCEWGWCVKSIYAPVRHIIFHDVKHRIFWHSIHLVRSIYIEKGGRDDSRHGQETRKEIPSRVYTVGFTRVLNRKFI